MALLIDARYIGDILKKVKHTSGIGSHRLADILQIDIKKLHRYEKGREIIPADKLEMIIRCGCFLKMARGN